MDRNNDVNRSSPQRPPLFLSSLRLMATLSSADLDWDGFAMAVTPVRVSDSVSIPPPEWHFLNIAPLDESVTIEGLEFTCGDVKDSLTTIHGARFQTLLPVGIPGHLEWRAASGGPLHLYLHHQWLVRAAEAAERDPAKIELTLNGLLQDRTLEHLGLALQTAFVAPGGCDRLFAETIANLLGMHLFRNFAVFPSNPREYKGGLAPWRLRRVIDYIQAHLGNHLSLNELASISELSPYHFGRLFKQSTGFSPHHYVTLARIEWAKRRLQERKLSLAEISMTLGFSGQSHFTTVFHKVTGDTPKTYSKS